MIEGRSWRTVVAGALTLSFVACGAPTRQTRVEQPPPVDERPDEQPLEEVGPAEPVSTEEGRRLLGDAEAAEARGDRVAARRVLERLVRDRPETVEGVRARLRLGEEALERDDWRAAERWVADPEPFEGVEQARYRRHRVLALAWEGQARYREAADAWLAASEAAPEPEAEREAIEHAAGDLLRAGELDRARDTLAFAGASVAILRAMVEERLDTELLARIADRIDDADPLAPLLHARLAGRLLDEGELGGAREAAERAKRLAAPMSSVAESAEKLLDRIDGLDTVKPRRIGVVLPLSGRYQHIGQGALEGVQIGLAEHPEVELVVRDSAGEAKRAAAEVESLVLDEHVVGILGPVGESESRAAAEVATSLGVPQVVLTSSVEAVRDLEMAHRVRLSAEEQAATLARHAVTALGIERVAILFPEGRNSDRAMGAFWDEVERLGGEVRAVERYDKGTVDFSPVLRTLLGAEEPGTGTFDFEALFVPDGARTVRRLVPFLKYWDLRVRTEPDLVGTAERPAVQLLGGAGWNHPSVLDRGDNLTDNAIFVDAWVHDPDDPTADRFARAFYGRYQRKPTPFHAEVRDAAALLAWAVVGAEEAEGHESRRALLEALRGVRHFRGATGNIAILDDGRVVRRPRLLTIDLDEIRPRLSEEEEAVVRRRDAPEPHTLR